MVLDVLGLVLRDDTHLAVPRNALPACPSSKRWFSRLARRQ
jgi:hypothetical protein